VRRTSFTCSAASDGSPSAANLGRAIALLEQALTRDSTFADAWALHADAIGWTGMYSGTPQAEVAARSRRSLGKAIELDPSNGFAIILRGWQHASDWSWDEAWSDMRVGLRLSPGSAETEYNYAMLLSFLNEPDSSVAHMRRAVQLDPTSARLWYSGPVLPLPAG
jgi:tetratricopeptide (TPR) repeat protein